LAPYRNTIGVIRALQSPNLVSYNMGRSLAVPCCTSAGIYDSDIIFTQMHEITLILWATSPVTNNVKTAFDNSVTSLGPYDNVAGG
jgi:hypothetical protein